MPETGTLGIDERSRIRDTLATYCHTIDDGRFDDFQQQFADDAVVEVMGQRIEGSDRIRVWMEQAMPPERRGRHITSNTTIDLGDGTATAVTDFLFFARRDHNWEVTQVGRYHDRLVLVDGTWRIALRKIVLGTTGE